MSSKSAIDRIGVALVAALALAPSEASAGKHRVPLADEHRREISSVRVIVNVWQTAIYSTYAPGPIKIAVDRVGPPYDRRRGRNGAQESWTAAEPVRAAMAGLDAADMATRAISKELSKLPLFQQASYEARRDRTLSPPDSSEFQLDPGTETLRRRSNRYLEAKPVATILDETEQDAVLIVDVFYVLTPDADHLVVTALAKLFPTEAARSPVLREFGKQKDRWDPRPSLYSVFLFTAMAVPEGEGTNAARWAADGGAAARRAVENGMQELGRLLAYDLQQGGPERRLGLYGPEGSKSTRLYQFGQIDDWWVLREEQGGGRTWYRDDEGCIGSVGKDQDAAPVPVVPAGG